MAQAHYTPQKTHAVALLIVADQGIAAEGPNLYRVQSRSVPGQSYVVSYAGTWACQCGFHAFTGKGCVHIEAARVYRRTGDPDQGVKPATYPQAWSAYNAAQAAEVRLFDALLADLASTVPEPHEPGANGRPPLPMREQVFCAVQKVYSQLSSRRAASLFGNAAERGQLRRAPHYNAVSKFLLRPESTPLLRSLIQQSALPLAGVEHDFAVDSTGFCTNVRGDFRMGKYGEVAPRSWLKAHLCVGVTTHIVADAIVTPSEGEGVGDSPNFAPLVASLAGRFEVREVSADLAYASKANHWHAAQIGAVAVIPFKGGKTAPAPTSDSGGRGAVGLHGSAKLWRKAHAYFVLHQEEFWDRYHKRSNVESVNSSIKRKFGEVLKSKDPVAQRNELLCKILAYNLTVLIHEMHEAGLTLNLAACLQTLPAKEV